MATERKKRVESVVQDKPGSENCFPLREEGEEWGLQERK